MFSSRKTAAPSGGYSIGKSLRFRSSATAYLSHTNGSNGNLQKWTYSVWVKRGILTTGTYYQLFGGGTGSGGNDGLFFDTTAGALVFFFNSSTTTFITNALYRDPSAWYHIVLSVDTTQATAANRCVLYVNGSQVTSFSTTSYPSQNANSQYINTTNQNRIGAHTNAGYYFDGYMAEINFIDGQYLSSSSFGAYDTNGVWQPIKYSGSYGTNGFYLPFSNTTSTTTLGYDSSGNGNNWTTNNISLTAGSTYDSMTDSPTVSSTSVANYCVLNPISNPNAPIYSITSGNLNYSCSSSPGNAPKMAVTGTILMQKSGKYYWEATETSTNSIFGITSGLVSGGNAVGVNNAAVANGAVQASAATYSGTTPSFTTNDVMGFAFDVSGLTLAVYKNGTLLGTFSGLESSVTGWLVLSTVNTGSSSTSNTWNFGQQGFKYTPPTNFNALNTYNLPASTINNGALYMAATTYTGTGSSNSISNGNNNTLGTTFQPDFVWVKSRSAATDHKLTDSVRGVTKALISDSTAAESTDSNGLTAFGSGGFTVGSDTNYNNNAATYVGWNWKAGGSGGSSNTNGSITSTVSANQTAGFSVVTWTGNGTAGATVGHGLGVAPNMIIFKRRSATENWNTYHVSLGNNNLVALNLTNAASSTSDFYNTTPTSSVFYLGSGTGNNGSGSTYVAYCFAAVSGYSAFGSYTGNGSTDGTFVYTGFRPRYVLVKRTDSTSDWYIWDTSRDTYNVIANTLLADTSGAETSATSIDGLSNGFKCRSATVVNASGGTYVYAAFAENPFNYSRAR